MHDMISINIRSFQGEKLISAIAEKLVDGFPYKQYSEDYISFDLPIGKIKCSTLNSGLAIGFIDLNENAPAFLFEFSGDSKEIPYKIGFCFKGSFLIEYPNENVSKTIYNGKNLIITPRPESRLYIRENEQTSFLYIFISPEFIREYFDIGEKELNLGLYKNQPADFLLIQGINSPQMNLALNELFKDNYSENLSKIMLESKTLELLTLFFHQFVVAEDKFLTSEKDSILNTHQYILSNLDKTITIKHLTTYSGLNEHKLQKGFKAIFGTTIQKHMKKLRVQKARQLILQQNFSVSEAGYAVGYTNLSHFASAFKQEYSILPSELKIP